MVEYLLQFCRMVEFYSSSVPLIYPCDIFCFDRERYSPSPIPKRSLGADGRSVEQLMSYLMAHMRDVFFLKRDRKLR